MTSDQLNDQFLNRVIFGWAYELNSNREKCTQPAITCSKLTIETVEQGVKYVQSSGIFIVNFERILHLVSFVNFEQVNAGW